VSQIQAGFEAGEHRRWDPARSG